MKTFIISAITLAFTFATSLLVHADVDRVETSYPGGGATPPDGTAADASMAVSTYQNGLAVIATPGNPTGSVTVPPAIAAAFEGLTSSSDIAAAAAALAKSGAASVAVIAAAAVAANQAAGNSAASNASIVDQILKNESGATPTQIAQAIAYGVNGLEGEAFAAAVRALRATALSGSDSPLQSSVSLDQALAEANVVKIVRTNALFDDNLNGQFPEGPSIGNSISPTAPSNLSGGAGSAPILTFDPFVFDIPTPTPLPPVTPIQNL